MKALETCSPTFYIITVYVLFIWITCPHKTQELPFIWTELPDFPFWLQGWLSLSSRVCLGFLEQVISLQLLWHFSVTGPPWALQQLRSQGDCIAKGVWLWKGINRRMSQELRTWGDHFCYLVLVSKVSETSQRRGQRQSVAEKEMPLSYLSSVIPKWWRRRERRYNSQHTPRV